MRSHRPFQWLRFLLQPAPAFGAAIIAILWIGLSYQLSVEHAGAIRSAIARGNGAARLFEETTIRLLKDVDRTLLFMRLTYENDPEHFDLNRLVQRTSLFGDLTIQASVIGPNGYMKSSSTGYSGVPLYLGDREHFLAHVNSTTDQLFIGKPLLGRASGQLSIQLSRRLRKPDGSFGGVIVSSIDPKFAQQFHQSSELGDQSSISVRGLDGVIRAAYGFSIPPTAMTSEMSAALAQAPSGHFWGSGSVDGINRLVSYRTLAAFPLIITVGEAENHVFVDYKLHRIIYFGIVVALTLLVAFAIIVIYRHQRSLERTNMRIRAALANMTHGLCMFDVEKRLVIWNQQYAKLYGLSAELLKIGTPHQVIIDRLVQNGILAGQKGADAADDMLHERNRLSSDETSS